MRFFTAWTGGFVFFLMLLSTSGQLKAERFVITSPPAGSVFVLGQ